MHARQDPLPRLSFLRSHTDNDIEFTAQAGSSSLSVEYLCRFQGQTLSYFSLLCPGAVLSRLQNTIAIYSLLLGYGFLYFLKQAMGKVLKWLDGAFTL